MSAVDNYKILGGIKLEINEVGEEDDPNSGVTYRKPRPLKTGTLGQDYGNCMQPCDDSQVSGISLVVGDLHYKLKVYVLRSERVMV